MGSSETNSTSSPSSSGKRSREPEDEVYLDNLHSHKRYLSEIMASSLNGLTVGDAIPDTIMESPARSESMFYLRDEMPYSPMSEDLEETRYYEPCMTSQPESLTTSPVVSPHRNRPLGSFSSSPPRTSQSSSSASTVLPFPSSQPRQRGSDTEGRFPSSPSDICHSADLRRAALLRSVHLRAHPLGPSVSDLPFSSSHETMQIVDQADDHAPCSYMKSLVDDSGYQGDVSGSEFEQEKPGTDVFNVDKGEDSNDQENNMSNSNTAADVFSSSMP